MLKKIIPAAVSTALFLAPSTYTMAGISLGDEHLQISLDGEHRELSLHVDREMLNALVVKELNGAVRGSRPYNTKRITGAHVADLVPNRSVLLRGVYDEDKYGDIIFKKVNVLSYDVKFDVVVEFGVEYGKFVSTATIQNERVTHVSGFTAPLAVLLDHAVGAVGGALGDPGKISDRLLDALVIDQNGKGPELIDFGTDITELYEEGKLSAKSAVVTEDGVTLTFSYNEDAVALLKRL